MRIINQSLYGGNFNNCVIGNVQVFSDSNKNSSEEIEFIIETTESQAEADRGRLAISNDIVYDATLLDNALSYQSYHMSMASEFLMAASGLIRFEGFYRTGMIVCHQAIEQACIGLWKVSMEITVGELTILNLLCHCDGASEKLNRLVASEKIGPSLAHELILNNCNNIRNNESFQITAEEAIQILEFADKMIGTLEQLTAEKIGSIRHQLNNL